MVACIYEELHEGTPEETTPSQEHVLAEALGGTLKLRKDLVCKACNGRLNSRVDMPTERAFRQLLNFFGITGKKQGQRPNAVDVLLDIDGKEVPGRLSSDRSLRIKPGPVTPEPVKLEDGTLEREFRLKDEEAVKAFLADLGRKYTWDSTRLVVTKTKAPRIKSLSIEGKLEPIYRAAAKTALNYLALRRPQLAYSSGLLGAKRFIVHGTAAGPHPDLGTSPEIVASTNQEGQLSSEGLLPMHRVAVGGYGDGGPLISTLVLFGKYPFQVHLVADYRGVPVHLEHEFDLAGQTHRVVDVFGVHPNAFQGVVAANAASRIRCAEFPSNQWHYLHEVVGDAAGWVRCLKCSAPARDESPSRGEALECHTAATRNSTGA